MQIKSISNNSFEGKIIFDKNISKQKIQTINKILDLKHKGATARERIQDATYDLKIFSRDTKRTVHPSVVFYTSFKTLNNPDGYSFTKKLKIDDDLYKNASLLNNFISRFEETKQHYYYSYNTYSEKLEAILKRFFGK